MKYVSLFIIGLFFLVACSKKSTPTATASTTTPTTLPGKPSKEAARGYEIYLAKCGKCHDLKKVDDYTATQWVPILDNMAKKAKLTPDEKDDVLTYVQFYAKGI